MLAAKQFWLYIPDRWTALGPGRRIFQSLQKKKKKKNQQSISSQQSSWHVEVRCIFAKNVTKIYLCVWAHRALVYLSISFTVVQLNMKPITNLGRYYKHKSTGSYFSDLPFECARLFHVPPFGFFHHVTQTGLVNNKSVYCPCGLR